MATPVVHLKRDPYDVYIGRAGHGQAGTFGNEHPVLRRCEPCSRRYARVVVHHGGGALKAYFVSLVTRCLRCPEFRAELLPLRDKTLGCFCAPAGGLTAAARPFRCHGQVLALFLDSLPAEASDQNVLDLASRWAAEGIKVLDGSL